MFKTYMLLSLGLLLACRSQQPTTENPPVTALPTPYEVLEQGDYGGIEEPGQRLIRDTEAWAALWQQLTAQRFPAPALPEVDFSQQVVVACFMGMQTTGGYAIRVNNLREANGQLYVDLTHTRPGRDCMVTEALTQPYLLLLVETRTATTATFSVEKKEQEC